jgi:hypothetical protein
MRLRKGIRKQASLSLHNIDVRISEAGLAFLKGDKQMSTSNSSPWWSDETLADALRQRQAAEEPTDDKISPKGAPDLFVAKWRSGRHIELSDWLEAEDQLRECKADG